jgi:hypothetical protein
MVRRVLSNLSKRFQFLRWRKDQFLPNPIGKSLIKAAIMIFMKRDDGPQKNRPPEKVTVLCYSGYRGEETPRAIIIGEKEIAVEKILSRKRTCDAETGRIREVFTAKTGRGIVRMERDESGEWTVVFL